MKTLVTIALTASVFAHSSAAQDQPAQPLPPPTKGEPSKRSKSPIPLKELTEFLPIGRTLNGVIIPSYGADSKLESILDSETVTRIDEKFLRLTEMTITTIGYQEDGSEVKESVIFMKSALYDLSAGILKSETPATVDSPDFRLTGDQLTYDAQNDITRVTENVVITIPEAGDMGDFVREESNENDPPTEE